MIPRSPRLRLLASALLLALVHAGCSPAARPKRSVATRTPESLAVARPESLRPPPSDSARRAARESLATAAPDTLARRSHDSLVVAPPAPAIRYRTVPIPGPRALDSLAKALGERGFANVLRVNRIDLDHARAGLPLVVPDPADSLPLLGPFPARVSAPIPGGRVIFVSQRIQAFAAYDSSRLVRWGPVSTGRRDKPTPGGVFHANWKAKQRLSTIDESWLLKWAINFDSREGISLHEYELPGRPASHSCVRLMPDDAEWLYGWVEQWKVAPDGRTVLQNGTPIVIFGAYDFDGLRPWKRLPRDPHATDLSAADLERAFVAPDSSAAPGRDSTATRGAHATPDSAALHGARKTRADSSAAGHR